jgi:hypothetical protein
MLASIYRKMDQSLIDTAHSVCAMLERLSADSIWAHRASGMRGSLFKTLEQIETDEDSQEHITDLDRLVQAGFALLEKAAREILEH